MAYAALVVIIVNSKNNLNQKYKQKNCYIIVCLLIENYQGLSGMQQYTCHLLHFILSLCHCHNHVRTINKAVSNKQENKQAMVQEKPEMSPRGGLWPVLLMYNPQGRPVPQQWGH
jgi:hypothetical protein